MQSNRKVHRGDATPTYWLPRRNRLAHARNKRGKRAPFPTANRTARTRIGHSVGSKLETPCPDGKRMSPAPRAQRLHSYFSGQRASDKPVTRSAEHTTELPSR